MNEENQNILGQNNVNNREDVPNTFGVPMDNTTVEESVNPQVAMMGGMNPVSENNTPPAAPLNIGVVNPLNGALEVPEEEEEEEELPREKTAAELDLERRNKSGLRFVIMFGLMVLIFIILLPFLITLF